MHANQEKESSVTESNPMAENESDARHKKTGCSMWLRDKKINDLYGSAIPGKELATMGQILWGEHETKFKHSWFSI